MKDLSSDRSLLVWRIGVITSRYHVAAGHLCRHAGG